MPTCDIQTSHFPVVWLSSHALRICVGLIGKKEWLRPYVVRADYATPQGSLET